MDGRNLTNFENLPQGCPSEGMATLGIGLGITLESGKECYMQLIRVMYASSGLKKLQLYHKQKRIIHD